MLLCISVLHCVLLFCRCQQRVCPCPLWSPWGWSFCECSAVMSTTWTWACTSVALHLLPHPLLHLSLRRSVNPNETQTHTRTVHLMNIFESWNIYFNKQLLCGGVKPFDSFHRNTITCIFCLSRMVKKETEKKPPKKSPFWEYCFSFLAINRIKHITMSTSWSKTHTNVCRLED